MMDLSKNPHWGKGGKSVKKLYLKQKIFSFADRYKVYDEKQNVVYHCEGKLFSIAHRIDVFDSVKNQQLFTLRRRLFRLMQTYVLTDPQGNEVAQIRRRFSFFKPKIDIEGKFGSLTIDGDLFAHHFSIIQDGTTVVDFSKKWIAWGDSYEITIHPDENTGFFVALVIMIDNALHDNRRDGALITFNR